MLSQPRTQESSQKWLLLSFFIKVVTILTCSLFFSFMSQYIGTDELHLQSDYPVNSLIEGFKLKLG